MSESTAPNVTIHPRQVFTIQSLTEALNLRAGTIPREIRLRRLRAAKRAGRIFITGAWVLEWLEGGELRRQQPATTNGQGSHH